MENARQTISPAYRVMNSQLHGRNPDYGRGGAKYAETAMRFAAALGCSSILDYGCGKGELGRKLAALGWRLPLAEYDPALPGKDAPPEPADLVVCTDVLEHVEPEFLTSVLADLERVARKGLIVAVHLKHAKKMLPDGRNAHLIIQPPQWWSDALAALWDEYSFGLSADGSAAVFHLRRRPVAPALPPGGYHTGRPINRQARPMVLGVGGKGGQVLMPAWANGLRTGLHPVTYDMVLDPARTVISWGLLRGTPNLYHRIAESGGDFIYTDHGYFRRGHFSGYYRACINSFQLRADHYEQAPADSKRWDSLLLSPAPWRRSGAHILVCPPSPTVQHVMGLTGWLEQVLPAIKARTDRQIVIRQKAEASHSPLAQALVNCWALVTANSMAAVEALFHGVPVVCDPYSAAWPCATAMDDIERPALPDRQPLFNRLANNQWTLAEIKSGQAWAELVERAP